MLREAKEVNFKNPIHTPITLTMKSGPPQLFLAKGRYVRILGVTERDCNYARVGHFVIANDYSELQQW